VKTYEMATGKALSIDFHFKLARFSASVKRTLVKLQLLSNSCIFYEIE